MNIISAKAKGRGFQNFVGVKIAALLGVAFGPDEVVSGRPMGSNGTDIRIDKSHAAEFPFSVECKRCESWRIFTWIKQAKDNAAKGTMWLIVARRSRDKAVVIMDFEDFLKLAGRNK